MNKKNKIILFTYTFIYALLAYSSPISLICWSNSFSSQNARITASKLNSTIESNCPTVKLSKMYLELPRNTTTESGLTCISTFMNNLNSKDKSTKFAFLASAASLFQKGEIDLSKLANVLDAGYTPDSAIFFLQKYAPQVIIDIRNMQNINEIANANFSSILFDVEAGKVGAPSYNINTKGIYYLLYYTRQYMNDNNMRNIGLETTLPWNQIQISSASTFISKLFGKPLPKIEIISTLLDKNKIATNIFAMLYRKSSQLIDSNNIIQTTWWKTYVAPGLDNLSKKFTMTITPSIGVNIGDPKPVLTHAQLVSFLNNYSNSEKHIFSEYKGRISPAILGIHGLEGFIKLLK